MICAVPEATRLTVTVVPERVAVAFVASVVAIVTLLLVAPDGSTLTVNVLEPPAAPVLVVGVSVTPVTATASFSITSMVDASPTLNSVDSVSVNN